MKMIVLSVATWACFGCASSPSASAHPTHAGTTAQADALAAQGHQLLERGDYVRAEQYLQVALQAGHDEATLIVPLLRSCIASNRLRSALNHAEHYLARHPEAWHVRYVKAALHRALDQPLLAQGELVRVQAAAPAALDAQDRAWLAQREAPPTPSSRRPRPIRMQGATR